MDAGHLRQGSGVDRRLHRLKITLCAKQRLRRGNGGRMQKGIVPIGRRAMLTPKCHLEPPQVLTAFPKQMGELAADQQIVRAQLAFAAIEVVAAAVEQVGQQPSGRPGPVNGIGDDLQLHTRSPPDPRLAPCGCAPEPRLRSRIRGKAQSREKTAHGTLPRRQN